MSAATNGNQSDTDDKQARSPPGGFGQREPKVFKIIVIGDSNVGKTCLTYRFCEGKFPKKVEATIGVDFRERTVDVGSETLKLQLWDTAGQERFRRSMVPHYYRNVHAVVYVYDMTKRSTFESLTQWLSEYNRHSLNQDKVPRILVGNKCDMTDLVAVSTNEAQRFADMNNMPAFETSARDEGRADHVESIFLTLAHKLKESKPMMGTRYSSQQPPSPDVRKITYTPIGQEKTTGCPC